MNMKFFSSHTISNTNSQMVHQNFYMPVRTLVKNPIEENLSILVQEPQPVKKVKWGEPVWFLLHTLSIKVREDEFKNVRFDLLNRIYAICINLPCPECANHAKLYLDNINFNAIQTKEDLKKMLHTFHNEVNKRKGYPFFPYDQLNEKYSSAITMNMIRNFMIHFSDRNRSLKLLATDLHRMQLCNTLKNWFNERIHCFHA